MRWAIFSGAIFLIPQIVLGYSVNTHAYLTEQAFDAFQKAYPGVIEESLRVFLIDGARREDDQFRALNHFYDPIKDRGFTSQALGNWNKSKDWAKEEYLQEQGMYKVAATISSILSAVQSKKISLISSNTNFTWQKGIRAYARGEKEESMLILGHVLHLLEDVSVPDHTRNDPHPMDSPYERWAVDKIIKINKIELRKTDDLSEAFTELALYSNKNFYSKNTIGINNYSSPEPDYFKQENKFLYGYKQCSGGDYKILIKKRPLGSLLISNSFDVDVQVEGESEVVKDYWDHLAPKAIEYSAGVIDLFIREGEKAKADPTFIKEEPDSWLGSILNTGKKILAMLPGMGTSENTIDIPSEPSAPIIPDTAKKSPRVISSKEIAYQAPNFSVEANNENAELDLSVANMEISPEPAIQIVPSPEIIEAPPAPRIFYGGPPLVEEPRSQEKPALPAEEYPTSTEGSDPISTSSIEEASSSSELKITFFYGEASNSEITLFWQYEGDGEPTSTIILKDKILYSGSATTTIVTASDTGDLEYFLKLQLGNEEYVTSTYVFIEKPNNSPGQIDDFKMTLIPEARTVMFQGKVTSLNAGNESMLEIEFLPSKIEFSGVNYNSPLTSDGDMATVKISGVQDGSYHWRAAVGEPGWPRSNWQHIGEGDLLLPVLQSKIEKNFTNSNFPNGYCGHGYLELTPEEDMEINWVDFWSACVNGRCLPPNSFRIFDKDKNLLAETDGEWATFGYPEQIRLNQPFKTPVHLKAGEVYLASPFSQYGQCFVNSMDEVLSKVRFQ